MFSAISQFAGKLFGTDKAINSVIENTSNALDKIWYTDEEKAEARAKSASEGRAMIIDWMKATQGQNLSRRIIALSITFVWLLQYLVSMTLSIAAIWVSSPETSKSLVASAKVIGDYGSDMTSAMMLILGFYFAATEIGNIASRVFSKKDSSPENK